MKNNDVLVIGAGLAGMEAMASGKPVIVSKANGLAEVLTDGENALLVPPRSPLAIAEAIKRLIEVPLLASTIGEEGSRFVREHFSWQNQAQGIVTLFKEALDKPAAHPKRF